MKWEYKAVVLKLFGDSLDVPLNKLGDDDWELIWWDVEGGAFIFKRPKSLDIKAKELLEGDVIAIKKVIDEWRKIG